MLIARPNISLSPWLGLLSCFALLNCVYSWSNVAEPVMGKRAIDNLTPEIHKIVVDPASDLEEHLDRSGATRFCDIGLTKYGRGLVVRRDMQPGETVLRIPLSEVIVVEESQLESSPTISDAWAGLLAQALIERQRQTKTDHVESITKKYSDALPPPPPTPARADWSVQALQALDDVNILREIEIAKDWRNEQWKNFGVREGALGDQQRFLDALDQVSSRTIRCGSKFMLVPFLDMANYASRDQGGGYYALVKGQHGDEQIELKIGERGVKAGEKIFLDYGNRKNEEWLIYYGFLPDRNTAENLVLPDSKRTITWDDANRWDESLKEECRDVLDRSSTSLGDDIEALNKLERDDGYNDVTMMLALKYRIARKTLLSAVAGAKTSSALSSVFL